MSAARTSSPPAPPSGPGVGIPRDLLWRIALVVLAAIVVMAGLPAWLRAPLSILAALATIEFFVRRYRPRGPIDALLVAVGGGVAFIAVLGVVLNVLPSGLSAANWAVGVGVIEAVTLVMAARRPAPSSERRMPPRRRLIAGAGWTVLIGGVLAGALVWSADSFDSTNIDPLALGEVRSGDSSVVTVSSGADSGPYELHLVSDYDRVVLAQDVEVGPGDSLSVTVPMPQNDRVRVQLVRPGSIDPVRELILDTVGETAVSP